MNKTQSNEEFCVLNYSIENLKTIFKSCSLATVELIEAKLQTEYFETYFESIGAKTIVVESDYLDNHYLDDYSEYYVKCFKNYQRTCNKLHFFTTSFNKSYFRKIINGEINYKELQDSYLGYIILKKLPRSIIGKTCLATYSNDSKRKFPATRIYKTNLFGIPLKVESLTYQEQDTVVAACASSALWSIFNATGKLFQHEIPSPVKITKSALDGAYNDSRSFPNRGLTLQMIAKAINSVGLEPYKVSATSEFILKATAYAYLKAKIPALMAIRLKNVKSNQTLDEGHAVAITGYKLEDELMTSVHYDLILKAANISKFYVHDDQVGPFARMEFKQGQYLSTSFGRSNGEDNFQAIPYALTIPLYEKIRIPFDFVLQQVAQFDQLMKIHAEATENGQLSRLEWDIYLINSMDLKEQLLIDKKVCPNKEGILLKQLPEYVWCTEICTNNHSLVNVLFDATDIEQNLNIVDCIIYDSTFFDFTKYATSKLYTFYPGANTNYFVRWFSSQSF